MREKEPEGARERCNRQPTYTATPKLIIRLDNSNEKGSSLAGGRCDGEEAELELEVE